MYCDTFSITMVFPSGVDPSPHACSTTAAIHPPPTENPRETTVMSLLPHHEN